MPKGPLLARARKKGVFMKLLSLSAIAGAAAIVLSLGVDAPARAASAATGCKGQAEATCKAQGATCTWVAPKKGKQKPYCRAKPAKKK
jgi:hypothetical protein